MTQKIIWMLFLIFGSFITFIGCNSVNDIEKVKTVKYIYKNESGVDLIMYVYNEKKELLKTFTIPNGNQILSNITREEVPSLFYFDNKEDKIGVSVDIRFVGDKCLYYSKNSNDKIFNISLYDNYSEDLINNNNYTLYYTIKPLDYTYSIKCK